MGSFLSRLRFRASLLLVLPFLTTCADVEERLDPAPTTTTMLWHSLGSWSDRGSRQTESFDVTTGALRVAWETFDESAADTSGWLQVSLHSSISGRPLQTIINTHGSGSDTTLLAAGPRVAFLRIESEDVRWQISLEEGVTGTRSPSS